MMNPRCNETLPPLVVEGLELFNSGEFYEAHEVLEEAWNDESQSIRNLYRGILQIDVGFYQLTRLSYNASIALLESGADLLEPFKPNCQGIEVAQFIEVVRQQRLEIIERGRVNIAGYDPATFPKIVYKR